MNTIRAVNALITNALAVVCSALFLAPTIASAQKVPNYESDGYRSGRLLAWGKKDQFGDNSRSMFACETLTAGNQVALRGNEMSWRQDNDQQAKDACGAWEFTTTALAQGKLQRARETANDYLVQGRAEHDGSPIQYLIIDGGSEAFAGWYVTRDKSFFSQGTFAVPLRSPPSSGVVVYKGAMSYDWFERFKREDLLKVDFSTHTISIALKFDEARTTNTVQIETESPLSFDPRTGAFRGFLKKTEIRRAGPVSIGRIGIAGTIGGLNGKVIAATLHTGHDSKHGFDFLVGTAK